MQYKKDLIDFYRSGQKYFVAVSVSPLQSKSQRNNCNAILIKDLLTFQRICKKALTSCDHTEAKNITLAFGLTLMISSKGYQLI